MVAWAHPLEACDGDSSQSKEHSGVGTPSATENIILLPLFKPYRALSHTILCNPPKEGLLTVGMGYNPFTGEEIEVQEISRLVWRVRTQGQAFSVQVCAFSMTSQRCDESAELYAGLCFLLHSLF